MVQRECHADGSATETITEQVTYKAERVIAKRKTYRQDWPAYNAAQTTEKHAFQVLLADLCRGIEEPEQEKGRPSASLRDMVFSAIFKVFSTVSARRFQCDLQDACQKGYIEKTPHFNTIFKYLDMPGMTAVLKQLVVESSLPLRSVESDFAVDSSGFTTSRFVRWFDHKYGAPSRARLGESQRDVRREDNVVTAVEIDGKDAGDSPQFRPADGNHSPELHVQEVSADKAYLSHGEHERRGHSRGLAVHCVQVNATAKQGGTLADVPLLQLEPRRLLQGLPQAIERGNDLLHGQGEIRR